jgi:hypothetical protein
MTYNFRNLIFEGGGVKGIDYLGAINVPSQKGIMKRGKVFLLLIMMLGLCIGCTSSRTTDEVRTEKAAAPAEPKPAPPSYTFREEYAKDAKRAPTAGRNGPEESKTAQADNTPSFASGTGMTAGGDATTGEMPTAKAEPRPAAKNGGGEPSRSEGWQNFLAGFKDAAYTFNPPSPVKVAKPYPIHLWVDTKVSHQALAEELKKLVPHDAGRVESGTIQVSPVMKATLTGENFTIKPNSPEQQTIHLAGRTIWSWDITPTWPGTQTLHLRLIAIPPAGIADPYTIPVPLDRTIEVQVTPWWLLDFFFDKYWKWLLGGLGTLLFTVLGWWWKKRSGEKG